MKEGPILFSGPMVRATLAGRKTQTRRVVKKQPPKGYGLDSVGKWGATETTSAIWSRLDKAHCEKSPHGQPGDRLWVRESHAIEECACAGASAVLARSCKYCGGRGSVVSYRADEDDRAVRWRPSIFMPRWASRIMLEIDYVRVECLQDISEEDAQAEGMEYHNGQGVGCSGWRHDCEHGEVYSDARKAFYLLWQSINGMKHPWEGNPWVWVYEFERV